MDRVRLSWAKRQSTEATPQDLPGPAQTAKRRHQGPLPTPSPTKGAALDVDAFGPRASSNSGSIVAVTQPGGWAGKVGDRVADVAPLNPNYQECVV